MGWDDAWAEEFAPYDTEGLPAGRVIRVREVERSFLGHRGTV
ncbi:hypothetical protein HEP87_61180 [Streptomyces sp. S1D4-11]|nr:hypothetical protein [Streptomyces sp. S1D4-11]